ncbi:hypothetical protein ALP29_200853 [Pseudomonas syringae pv. avii]|uniref:Uncharacterized protein n=1 Tax=Pseudomonas syringae pv. avii TaxID=663959 RepID=A0A3M5U6F7_PSESX|nr:hypothetical protein ALP29_200853 [Pseudomonas syringae pv. avii]
MIHCVDLHCVQVDQRFIEHFSLAGQRGNAGVQKDTDLLAELCNGSTTFRLVRLAPELCNSVNKRQHLIVIEKMRNERQRIQCFFIDIAYLAHQAAQRFLHHR